MESEKLFISYASEDRAIVMTYVEALSRVGLTVWVDQQEIAASDSIVGKINAGMKGTKYALIFFSASYNSKVWTQEEMAALVFAAISSGQERKVFVIRLDSTDLDPILAHRLWRDQPEPATLASDLSKIIFGNFQALSLPGEMAISTNQVEGKDLNYQDIDDITAEIIAHHIVERASEIRRIHQRTVWIEVVMSKTARIRVRVFSPLLSEDMIADIKSSLKIININKDHVRNLNESLEKGGLGIFESGFKIELKQKLENLDNARKKLAEYLDAVTEKLLWVDA